MVESQTKHLQENFYRHIFRRRSDIAITPQLLARRDLEAGRLIAPLGFIEAERPTFLYLSAARRSQPDIAAFRQWLVHEAESDAPPLI